MNRFRMPGTVLAALGLFGALVLGPVPAPEVAHAATFTVTTTQDAPHTAPLDGNCTSTAGGTCTLRAAIQAANFLGSTQTINLPSTGTYQLTVVGADEDAAATGDLDVNGVSLTIANTSGGPVMFDAIGIDRVFDVGPRTAAQVTIADVTIQNGRVDSCDAPYGGGVLVRAGSSLTLNRTTLTSNGAGAGIWSVCARQGGAGGGILNAGTLILNASTVSNNTADVGAFGIISNVTVGPGAGGAIYNLGSLIATNTTISGNKAIGGCTTVSGEFHFAGPGEGGGIYNRGTVALTNVTVAKNAAGGVGCAAPGYSLSTGVTVKNSILAGPTGNVACAGAVTSQGDNISSDSSCGLTGPGDRQNTDPKLGPLQDNGGPTPTHALLVGSPAIDGVQHNACPPHSTDQRGYYRPGGSACDVGAYEANASSSPCALRPPFTVATVPDGTGRLRATVTAGRTALWPDNWMLTLRFVSDPRVPNPNALIDIPGSPQGATVPLTVSLPTGTLSTTFYLRPITPGQAVTVALAAVDACGDWPTLVGGGPSMFATATPASAPTAVGAAPSSTPATLAVAARPPPAPPAPAPVCAPRPTLAVATTALGAGRLQVTVTAPASANDRLLALRFGAATNARIDAGGPSGTGSFSVSLPPGTQQTSFTVTRVTSGQAVTVPLTVVDSCGEWPTVLGGGPSAF